MTKICIIGAGVSGILLILLLQQSQQIPLDQLTVIDPYFDGGDLIRKWGSVVSNTPWSKTLDAFATFLPSISLPEWARQLPPTLPTPLSVVAQLCRELVAPALSKTTIIQGLVEEANCTTEWTLSIRKQTGLHTIRSNLIFFTQGSNPKMLDLPIPSIPLEIALNPTLIHHYVKPNQRVVVFGTSHSGTLVIKNLVDCSAQAITAFYKGSVPFMFARDGVYDGIKLDAATIADAILANTYPSVHCCSIHDVSTLIRESRRADWVVYAIGFEPRDCRIQKDGVPIPQHLKNTYDGATGICQTIPHAWGFGIAYPNQAPDGKHWDVGIYSFLEHINAQIPTILSSYRQL
jgi:hypothetical protein